MRKQAAKKEDGALDKGGEGSWVFTTDILFRCFDPKSVNGSIVFTRTEIKTAAGMKSRVCDCAPGAIHLHIGHNEAVRTGEVKAMRNDTTVDATTDVVISCAEHRIRGMGYQHVRVIPTNDLSLAKAMNKWFEWRKWKVRQELEKQGES